MSDMSPTSDFQAHSQAAEAAALAAEDSPVESEPVEELVGEPLPDGAEILRRQEIFGEGAWDRGDGESAEPVEPAAPKPELLPAQEELDALGLGHLDAEELEAFLADRPDIREAYFSEPSRSPADFGRAAALADSLRRQVEAGEEAAESAIEWATQAFEEGEYEAGELLDHIKATHGLEAASALAHELDAIERPEAYESDDEPLTAAEWAARQVAQQQAEQRHYQEHAAAEAWQEQNRRAQAEQAAVQEFLDKYAAERPDFDPLIPTMEQLIAANPAAFAEGPTEETLSSLHRSAAEIQRVEEAAYEQARAETRLASRDPYAPSLDEEDYQAAQERAIAERMATIVTRLANPERLLPPATAEQVQAQAHDGALEGTRRRDMFEQEGASLRQALDRVAVAGDAPDAHLGKRPGRPNRAYEKQVMAAFSDVGRSRSERVASLARATGGEPVEAKEDLPPGVQTYESWAASWGA